MKVMVIRFSSLGDCVLLCPFLSHLKTHGAEEVTVVTKRAYIELFSAVDGLDRIVALDKAAGLRGLRQIVKTHRRRGYVVIDAHNSWRSRLLALGLGGARTRLKKYYRQRLGLIAFKLERDIPTVSARYSDLGESLGFPALDRPAGGIEVPAAVRDRMRTRLAGLEGDTVAVAPGSRWPMKRWGMEKYLELTRRIVERMGLNVVLLGDEADIETTAPISNAFGRQVINLAGQTSILEAAAVIEHAVAFVGNDSGLMHLSEAVGVPIVALFGPTVKSFGYFPSNPRSTVIERDIGCRPCSRNGSRPCPKGTQECLTEIPVEPVWRALGELINNRGTGRYVIPQPARSE